MKTEPLFCQSCQRTPIINRLGAFVFDNSTLIYDNEKGFPNFMAYLGNCAGQFLFGSKIEILLRYGILVRIKKKKKSRYYFPFSFRLPEQYRFLSGHLGWKREKSKQENDSH
jgi:hypothetical protein